MGQKRSQRTNGATAESSTGTVSTQPPVFSLRSLILAIVMGLFVTVLINADLGGWNTYSMAYDSRIGFYAERLDTFTRISSWRKRNFMRHVGNVEIPLWITENMRPGDTILLPPKEYADQFLNVPAIWTDARIFTYFAGFQPIVAFDDTARWNKVNAFIALEPRSISIARRGGPTNLDSLLAVYRSARSKP